MSREKTTNLKEINQRGIFVWSVCDPAEASSEQWWCAVLIVRGSSGFEFGGRFLLVEKKMEKKGERRRGRGLAAAVGGFPGGATAVEVGGRRG
ncbi:hypothetical protein HAX54_036746 [Datura stramonium]|uniref:Uncharacterized protein n=1 Tax=Datura stramonium TaxID=4076 RepID=A0ABS8Y9R9_DATST|nr:hypothetical protein [Datura stramonium]